MRTPVTSLVEIRVLDGPNLYFPRAAVKVTVRVPRLAWAAPAELVTLARAAGRPLGLSAVGAPGSSQRQAALLRLLVRLTRAVARAGGTARLAVRARPGAVPEDVVIAFVWRHHDRAVALAEGLVGVLDELPTRDVAVLVAAGGATVRAAPAGRRPSALRPTVPVASVTGTNGKTTTTRLIAHLAMTAGLRTSWSSTDGVVVQGETVVDGDYSGPAGAAAALGATGVQVAVLETARGGLLLRGMGVVANDVSVVTNVSADHLGLHGIETLDQLAEVKAVVTRVTVPQGWAVLNGEDPRVWAMRAGTPARPWAFALDPTAPALREALDAGGRGATVLDGDLVVVAPGAAPDHLLAVVDVPVTLAGLSAPNVANALAAAAAGLGLGLPREGVVEGLRTFAPDPALNPGRMNLYSLAGVTVVLDLAHNEAGLAALLAVCRGVVSPGGRVLLGLGTAGDRTDDVLRALGEMAARGADVTHVVHKEVYLRGRTAPEMEALFAAGAADVGGSLDGSHGDEMEALVTLLGIARAGDVVALMTHAERPALDAYLRARGATVDTPDAVRRKVIRS